MQQRRAALRNPTALSRLPLSFTCRTLSERSLSLQIFYETAGLKRVISINMDPANRMWRAHFPV